MSERILFVDDDANVLASYTRQLRKRFKFVTAQGGDAALAAVGSDGPFAVVVSDMQMPGMNGVELLGRFAELHPDTVRMMLTGNADQQTAMDAVNAGRIFRFITKPCPPEDLAAAIDAALAQYRLLNAERELLEQTLAGSIKVLVDVLSLVDPEAFGRTRLLRGMTRKIAGHLKLPNLWQLDMAAMLSPIGRITLPNEVTAKLRKRVKLDADERAMVARVPEISRDLIANIPRLQDVSEIIYYQAKGFDGSGFPEGQAEGEDIPVGARVLRLVNDLVKLSAGQPKDPEAWERLNGRAQLYDPQVLAAARALYAGDSQDKPDGAQEKSEAMTFGRLRPGDLLASNIETADDQLILAAGNELSEALLEKLRNLHRVRTLKEPIYVVRPSAGDPQPEKPTAGKPAGGKPTGGKPTGAA